MSLSRPSQSPILLVGAQRSGTTALGCALSAAAAEKAGTFTVNGKLPYYLKRWWLQDPGDRHGRADEITYSLLRRKPLGVGIDEWLARCESALREGSERLASMGEALDCWNEMRKICKDAYGTGATVWGDKYYEYLLDLPFLNELFPQAAWIFLARDPRQVVTSMLQWSGDRPWNPQEREACARKWSAWNTRWLEFRSRIPKARRIELLYGSPLDALCTFLSESFDLNLAIHLRGYEPAVYAGHSENIALPTEALQIWATIQDV